MNITKLSSTVATVEEYCQNQLYCIVTMLYWHLFKHELQKLLNMQNEHTVFVVFIYKTLIENS